jgi:small subunit ribosomal protein S2
MASVGIKELLEAGVHFGHQTRRWNPKMRRYIYGERGGIYIIDLLKTERLLNQSLEFVAGVARRGGTILFVGTKKQARDAVKEVAESCGMPYVNHRWLGGLLTNFQTISLRIKRLHDLERFQTEGQLDLLPTQERMAAQSDLEKLQANLGGVKFMQRPPDAIVIIDLKTEAIGVREAQRLRIPIIGLVDTNCDPDGIDYVIPGNDDAIRSCSIVLNAIGDVIKENRAVWQRAEEERLRREAEEAARRAAEEAARRAAEEEARREAEAEAAERVEDRQGDAAATPKAREPVEGGRNQPRASGRPQIAPTITEDLPPRPGPRGKRKAAQTGAVSGAELAEATQAGQMPDEGAAAPAKAATEVARRARHRGRGGAGRAGRARGGGR